MSITSREQLAEHLQAEIDRPNLEQVQHGDGIASSAVNGRAAARGHGIRTGLEDTPVLPDGRPAAGNGELIASAMALLNELETDAKPGAELTEGPLACGQTDRKRQREEQ